MNLRITLKLWNRYMKEHKKRIEEHEAEGIINYASSDDDNENISVNPRPKSKGNAEIHNNNIYSWANSACRIPYPIFM